MKEKYYKQLKIILIEIIIILELVVILVGFYISQYYDSCDKGRK